MTLLHVLIGSRASTLCESCFSSSWDLNARLIPLRVIAIVLHTPLGQDMKWVTFDTLLMRLANIDNLKVQPTS